MCTSVGSGASEKYLFSANGVFSRRWTEKHLRSFRGDLGYPVQQISTEKSATKIWYILISKFLRENSMKPAYAFLLGCLVTGAALGIYIGDLKSRLGSSQNQGQFVVQQQARELQQMKEQRDTCQAKFS